MDKCVRDWLSPQDRKTRPFFRGAYKDVDDLIKTIEHVAEWMDAETEKGTLKAEWGDKSSGSSKHTASGKSGSSGSGSGTSTPADKKKTFNYGGRPGADRSTPTMN